MTSFLHLLFLSLVVFYGTAVAEVYQWTDENGKVHFTDRPPSKSAAEKVDVSSTNVDESSRQLRARGRVFPKNDSEPNNTATNERDRTAARERKALANECAQARQNYRKLKRPVVFIDEEGRSIRKTRAETDKMAAEYKQEIDARCKGL